MPLFKFISYFFYLAGNWNLSIAWHIIRQEIRGEKKYEIDTIGADELKKLQQQGIDISHATIYMPASYDMLEIIFEKLRIYNVTHLIDLGCGKGRALCVAAFHNIKEVTGVDFSKEFCNAANENLVHVQSKFPELQFKVVNNDAFYFEIPADADCVFLFNPFDETIMSGVAENITISLELYPRDFTIVYLNPLQKKLFIDMGFNEVFHTKKLNYLEGCILIKKNALHFAEHCNK